LGHSRAKVICPLCLGYFEPDLPIELDGACFSPSLSQILFKTFPDLYLPLGRKLYIPKIFGFKIFG
jgi:hypothetical protein